MELPYDLEFPLLGKRYGVYIHSGILFSHKKNKFALCNNMDGLSRCYANEVSQREKDKHCITSLVCGI